MQHQADSPEQIHTPWWNSLAIKPSVVWMLIFVLLILRILWQYLSPYTLVEDEAHYWDWSRHLDWSYYSKGPGVAWIIYLSTSILGHTEFAIRIPAAIATAIGTIAVARTAQNHLEDQRLTFVSALLYSCVPGFAVASLLMTIDAPYIAAWALASCAALNAILKGKHSSWIWFGLWIAIGFIFKYTILLLLPGVLLALVITKSNRPKLKASMLIAGLIVASAGLIPVLLWNANHDWATFRHLLGHLGAPGGDTKIYPGQPTKPWTILWSLEYIALQLLVGGPVIILAIYAYLKARHNESTQTQTALAAMIALASPILIFYFIVSLITQTEGNWAIAACVTLIPPAAFGSMYGVERHIHKIKFLWGAGVVTGLLILIGFPLAPQIAKIPRIGKHIPIERLTGMRQHVQDTQASIDDLAEYTGMEPIIMCVHYGRASLLSFYLPDQTIYCTSARTGGRKTQYDIWTHTDLTNPDVRSQLLGRPGILFGGQPHHWDTAFDQLSNIGARVNEPKENQTTYIGFNYHTFDTWLPLRMRDQPENQHKD